MGGGRPAGCARDAVVVPPRMAAYTEASKAVFEVFEDTTPLVEGLSIDEAFLDVGGLRRIAGTPTEIAARLRRDVRERVGLPITVGVARTKFLAKVASGVAKPDGLLVVPPDARARLPPPAAGRAALGRRPGHRGEAARPRHHHGRRGRPARRARRWSRCSAGPPAATCTRWPTTATRGRCEPRRRRRSIGSQRALGRSPRSPERDRRRSSSALVDRVTPPHARRATASAAPSCCGCASTTSPAPPARTRCRTPRPRTPQRSSPPLAGCWPRAMPLIERRGLTLVGDLGRQPRATTAPSSSSCRSTRPSRDALDAALDEVREPLRLQGGHPGRPARPRAAASAMPLLPDLDD